jgi:hypothetical protein
MKKINWDKAVEAIKYSSRAKADFRGYLVGMGIAIGSLILYCIDGTKANKANAEFQKSIDDWKEENASEEED